MLFVYKSEAQLRSYLFAFISHTFYLSCTFDLKADYEKNSQCYLCFV